MTERQEKIRKLVRENRGTAAKPEFLQRIAEALDEKVSEKRLLDLVATDELRQSFGAGYKSSKDVREACFAHYFPKDKGDTVFQLLKCFSMRSAKRLPSHSSRKATYVVRSALMLQQLC